MSRPLGNSLSLIFAAISLAGCGWLPGLDNGNFRIGGIEPPTTTATSLQTDRPIDPSAGPVDLTKLIVEHTTDGGGSGASSACVATNSIAQDVEKALARFYKCGGSDDDLRAKRNRIQGRLIQVSDYRCAGYKTELQQIQSTADFSFGTVATLLGAGAAITTSENAARFLGGSAGAASGIGAKFDKAYFGRQLVSVLNSGIDMKRLEIHQEIAARRGKTVDDYTLEIALADAFRYAGACSLHEGLYAVHDQIARSGEVGLDQVAATLKKIRDVHAFAFLNANPTEPTDEGKKKEWQAQRDIASKAEAKEQDAAFLSEGDSAGGSRAYATFLLQSKNADTSSARIIAFFKKLGTTVAKVGDLKCDSAAFAAKLPGVSQPKAASLKTRCDELVASISAASKLFDQNTTRKDDGKDVDTDKASAIALDKSHVERRIALSSEQDPERRKVGSLELAALGANIKVLQAKIIGGAKAYASAVDAIEAERSSICSEAAAKSLDFCK